MFSTSAGRMTVEQHGSAESPVSWTFAGTHGVCEVADSAEDLTLHPANSRHAGKVLHLKLSYVRKKGLGV